MNPNKTIIELHSALTDLLKAVDDEGWQTDDGDYIEQINARKALSNTPNEYLTDD